MKSLLPSPRRRPNQERWIGILLALGLGILAYIFQPTGHYLRHLSHDLPYLFQGTAPLASSQVVVVHMDDASENALHRKGNNELWDRSLHSRLLRNLDRLGARMVVFGLLFDQPWSDPAVDLEFARAIDETRCDVVLAARLDEPGYDERKTRIIRRLVKAAPPLDTSSAWGIMEQPVEPDGIIRRHARDTTYPNLAWRSAQLLGQEPKSFSGREWIRFYGTSHFVPTLSYAEIIQPESVARETVSGKIIVVGQGRRFDPDHLDQAVSWATPLTRWNNQTSTGPEIHASILLNLLRGDWIREWPATLEWFSFLFGALFFGWWLPRFRPLPMLGVSLVSGLFVMLLAVWLFHNHNLWFPWMVPVGVQLPALTLWTYLMNSNRLLRQREVLEKIAVTQSAAPPGRTAGASLIPANPAALSARETPTIPDHTLVSPIGKGAYGRVWLAKNRVGLWHAIKIVRRRSFDSVSPYEREFRGIEKFMPVSRTHPGLVQILHVGRNDQAGYYYYVMEIADDQRQGTAFHPDQYQPRNLAQDLSRLKRLPVNDCIELGLALSDALDHLHRHQLVHRDIKPSNIIFVNHEPKLADIGLVTDLNGTDSRKTFIGTEGYIPPEGAGTTTADVFSLGKVLYEAAMGKNRFQFPDFPTTLVQDGGNRQLQALNRIILKACEHDASRRYPTAADLRNDLLALVQCQDFT